MSAADRLRAAWDALQPYTEAARSDGWHDAPETARTVDGTAWGMYTGDTVTRSNYTSLLESFDGFVQDDFTPAPGGGVRRLVVDWAEWEGLLARAVIVEDREAVADEAADLAEALRAMADEYPLHCDDTHSQVEWELITDSLDECTADDILRAACLFDAAASDLIEWPTEVVESCYWDGYGAGEVHCEGAESVHVDLDAIGQRVAEAMRERLGAPTVDDVARYCGLLLVDTGVALEVEAVARALREGDHVALLDALCTEL